jgi:hypothetical protein
VTFVSAGDEGLALLSVATESISLNLREHATLQALMKNASQTVVVDWHVQAGDTGTNATLLEIPGLLTLHWDSSADLLMTTHLHELLVSHNAQAVASKAILDGSWHHIAVGMRQTTVPSNVAIANHFGVVNGTVSSGALALELLIDGQQAAKVYIELRREISNQSLAQAYGDNSVIVLGRGITCGIDQLRVWISPERSTGELASVAIIDGRDLENLAAFVSFDSKGPGWPELQEHTGKSHAYVVQQVGTDIRSKLVPSGASFGVHSSLHAVSCSIHNGEQRPHLAK